MQPPNTAQPNTAQPPNAQPIERVEIAAAAERISSLIRRTPTMTIPGSEFDLGDDVTVSLKFELMQHSGSFKGRGASNFMLAKTQAGAIGPSGVVAASGGNHGAAVAWAAKQLGHRATIFVPTISAAAKVERLRGYGADVHQVGDVYADALAASLDFQASSGATPIHAFNDPLVVAGAGTTGREFADQVDHPLTTILVACGGGGLAGGIAAWFGREARVATCETEGTAAHAKALAAGGPVDVEVTGIAADALGATRIGDLAWACLAAAGAENVVVTDDDVRDGCALLWDQFRVVAEPSAAVPMAAITSGRFRPEPGEHLGIVICGANTSLGS